YVDEESQDCEPCHRSCLTCGGPRFDDCDSCEEGLQLKHTECLEDAMFASCPEKKFRNGEGQCESCHSTCESCTGGGREDCSSCSSGRYLTAHQSCSSRCPSGTFANRTSGQCDDCLPGCVVCQDGQRCQRCRSGYTQLYLQAGVCVVECQRGFPQDGACQPCARECGSCQGNSTHCLSCTAPFLLLGRSCRRRCPDAFYATETECLRCPADCRECNSQGLCQECAEFYFLHEDKCVDDCPSGFFSSEEQKECVRCHADCASCDGPDWDDCDVCRNAKAVRYNGECLPECPTNTYYDHSTNECRECDGSCLTCSGPDPSSCLSCDADRRQDSSGHCVWYSRCSLHTFMSQDGECEQCHQLCHRCSGAGKDRCLSCNKHRLLLNSSCVDECPLGFYVDSEDGVCERCHFSCLSCVGRHSVQCDACKPGFYKEGNTCVQSCSEGHYGNASSRVCERCDPACSSCLGRSSRNCLSCRGGFLFLKQWGQCLQSCPPKYYHNTWTHTCNRCHPSCNTCHDEGPLSCSTCYEGYRYLGGICVSSCLVGFYPVSQGPQSERQEPQCEACDPACVDCRGPSIWNCTVCPALDILAEDGRCLSCCGNETRLDGKPTPRSAATAHSHSQSASWE
ncbi:proprotein convertase subtilisin/kexin type 5-like, partial [Genypterus blacodes]|uniref:proprotein convertase subtilisin/kexin type 5-like n=1 Tax=Genypterus blacodes TaxID=154954 RepID=UPI003F75A99A